MKLIISLTLMCGLATLAFSQNFGIGTTSPDDVLHLGSAGGIRFSNSEYENTSDLSGVLMFDENYYPSGEPGYPHFTNANDGGGLAFKNEDGWGALVSTANMQFLDMHLNTLHIGDASADPEEIMQVSGSAYLTDRIRVNTSTSDGRINAEGSNDLPGLWLDGEDNIWFDDGQVRITTHDGFGNWQIKTGADNDDVKIGNGSGAIKLRWDENGTFRIYTDGGLSNGNSISWNLGVVVTSDGDVGIGTTSPSEALHVSGTACYVGFSTSCSDQRYKRDFQPLANCLENISKIRGGSFYWKTEEYPEHNFSEDKQIGFIAQELEAIYPEVVSTGNDGYKSVDYARLNTVLAEATEELSAQVQATTSELQKIVDDLKAQNHMLRTDNARINQQIIELSEKLNGGQNILSQGEESKSQD